MYSEPDIANISWMSPTVYVSRESLFAANRTSRNAGRVGGGTDASHTVSTASPMRGALRSRLQGGADRRFELGAATPQRAPSRLETRQACAPEDLSVPSLRSCEAVGYTC
jgi:hypothetical protein